MTNLIRLELFYIYRGRGIYCVKGSVPSLLKILHHRRERGRKGRECKFQYKAPINISTPEQTFCLHSPLFGRIQLSTTWLAMDSREPYWTPGKSHNIRCYRTPPNPGGNEGSRGGALYFDGGRCALLLLPSTPEDKLLEEGGVEGGDRPAADRMNEAEGEFHEYGYERLRPLRSLWRAPKCQNHVSGFPRDTPLL